MKRLLVKIASKMIHKYGYFDLDLNSRFVVNGTIYTVTEMAQVKDCFKNDISIKASDIIPVAEWKH